MLGKVITFPGGVLVGCSLLKLCRRHVVLLQMKVLHVANIQQLVGNFWRASSSEFLPKLETSSDSSREVPDTSCSNVADGSRQIGGPSLLRTNLGTLRFAKDSRFGTEMVAPEVYPLHLLSSQKVVRSGRTRGLSSSSSSSSWV